MKDQERATVTGGMIRKMRSMRKLIHTLMTQVLLSLQIFIGLLRPMHMKSYQLRAPLALMVQVIARTIQLHSYRFTMVAQDLSTNTTWIKSINTSRLKVQPMLVSASTQSTSNMSSQAVHIQTLHLRFTQRTIYQSVTRLATPTKFIWMVNHQVASPHRPTLVWTPGTAP